MKNASAAQSMPIQQQQNWPSVLPTHSVQQPLRSTKETMTVVPPRETDAGTAAQLQLMQQSLDQLVQLVTAQRVEQQQLKSEITQLKSEMTRIQSPDTVQPSWISQMEATLAVYFDRQLKKLDEINSPSKTQQVTRENHFGLNSNGFWILFNLNSLIICRSCQSCMRPSVPNSRIKRTR